MGEDLCNSKMGTTIGKGNPGMVNGINISAMFFEDDLILISEMKKRTPKTYTNFKLALQ